MLQVSWTRGDVKRTASGSALVAFAGVWLVIDPLEAALATMLVAAILVCDRSLNRRSSNSSVSRNRIPAVQVAAVNRA